jgi:hypothetical protein
MKCGFEFEAQNRKSAKLILHSLELGLPNPLTRRLLYPHLLLVPRGGAHSLAGGGWGGGANSEGTYTVELYVYVYFVCRRLSLLNQGKLKSLERVSYREEHSLLKIRLKILCYKYK